MAKVDLKNAFRICPVRKEDWHLLGICWQNLYYVDKCLPFGLRSAPYLFNLSHLFHCLDDFFFVAPALSPDCLNALLDMLLLCEAVGAPVKPEKVQGPATTLTILGIELDTVLKQARLPPEKLTALLAAVRADAPNASCCHS